MKKLYLIRHAKSSWKDLTLDDYDRPLNKRGKRNAPLMGKVLATKHVTPDLIVSSGANRAITTAKLIAQEIDYDTPIQINDSIYEASLQDLVSVISNTDNDIKTLFLIGHNPSLNQFAYNFIDFEENIPTAAILSIEFQTNNWNSFKDSLCKQIFFDFPRNYEK